MGILASFVTGAALFYLQHYFPWASISIGIVTILIFTIYKVVQCRSSQKFKSYRFAAAILLPFVFMSLGYWRAVASYIPPPDMLALSGQVADMRGTAAAAPLQLQSERVRFLNDMEIKEATVSGTPLQIEKLRLFTDSQLDTGKEYMIKAKFPADNTALNPGSKEWLLSGYAIEITEAGIVERNFLERSRDRLNAYLSENFKGDAGAFLMSIITGDRGSMSKEIKNAFNVTGLAHILSISGAHFGLLLFICFKFFKLLVKLLPHNMLLRLSLYVSPSQVAALLCLPIITAYLGISTMEFPAVRSFIMIILFLFGLLIFRKGFWMNTILFAAALIVLIQPDALTQLSCQLSFLAVVCLGLYAEIERSYTERQRIKEEALRQTDSAPALPSLLEKIVAPCKRYIVASSMISIAATAGTAPLVAYSFNYFSIISPLSNMIVTPIIGFVILPLALMSSFIYLIFGVFPLRVFIDWATNLSIEMIRIMGSWDFAAIQVPTFPGVLLITFYLAMLVYAVISIRKPEQTETAQTYKRTVAACVIIAVLPFIIYAGHSLLSPRLLKTTFLDVGQGDSAVVELPDNKIMVIDTGKNGFPLANFLKYRGINRIDLLVLTHGHPDHAGGLTYLLSNFKVKELWENNYMTYREPLPADISIRHVERGDFVKTDNYRLSVFHPIKNFILLAVATMPRIISQQ
jgi:competence protein ComEC